MASRGQGKGERLNALLRPCTQRGEGVNGLTRDKLIEVLVERMPDVDRGVIEEYVRGYEELLEMGMVFKIADDIRGSILRQEKKGWW